MIETLVVRTFGIDVSDTKVSKELPWKIGRLFPWLFTETAPVCFLGVGRGWRGWKRNGSFSSYALLKAIPSDRPVLYHINRVLAWIANFIDVVRIASQSNSSPLVVLAHTPQFGLGAALAKILFPKRLRFVVRLIGNDPSVSLLVRRSRWRFELEQKLERFVLRRADIVLPMGSYTYDLTIAYGVDPRKIVVLPFPVTWLTSSKTTDLPARPTVLFCGRLIKEKGVHILLQAMKLVRQRVCDAQLVIVGDTDNKTYRHELEKIVDSLGIRDLVSFLGWIPNDDIGKIYQESWMLVVPSIWEEGLGMVMVEAGLMERAVIGSDLGGIKDFIQNGANGLLVPPGDVQALADAISSILEDRVHAVEMGKQNSVKAQRYLDDFDRAVTQVQEAIYNSRYLTSGSGGRTLSQVTPRGPLNKNQKGDSVRQAEFRREQWKDWLPTPVRAIGRHGKSVGRRLLGVRKKQWLRVVMDGQTEKFVRSLSYSSMDAIEVSGDKWENFGFRSYRKVHYPEYDLCEKPLEVAAFDIVIVEQVLEHVLWPYRAVRNVFEILRPGGIFLVTTPFLIRMHERVDCSRWSETGLKHLLIEGGFNSDHITTGSWGNRACVYSNFQTWTGWIPWKHSLKNEPKFPVVVWAFAKKSP